MLEELHRQLIGEHTSFINENGAVTSAQDFPSKIRRFEMNLEKRRTDLLDVNSRDVVTPVPLR